jgi:hypothetical protein
MSCHQPLMKNIGTDTRHQPMLECIQCHSAEPNSMAECGSDCFACHPQEKIDKAGVPQHKVIRECRECHMQLRDTLFSLPVEGSSNMGAEPLKDFLLK